MMTRPGLLGCVALAALFGGQARAETIKVLNQGSAPYVATYQQVAKRFEAANPGTTIEFIATPHDGYVQQLASAVAAKNLPDIIQIDAPYLANYVWSGLVRPVEGLIDPSILSEQTPSGKAQGTYPIDNKQYAVNLIDSSVAIYGNRKYLQQVGARIPTSPEDAWTRAEFENILTKLAAIPGVAWPIDLLRGRGSKTEWVTYGYSPIFQSMGCDLIDRKTWKAKGTLDSAPCVEAGKMMQSWVAKGWVVPQSAGMNQLYAAERKAAITMAGDFYFSEAKAGLGDDIVVIPLPRFGAKSVSPNGTWIWGVTTSSKSPQMAGKFISFLIRDQGFVDFMNKGVAHACLRILRGLLALLQQERPNARHL